jgi:hypothetical protein
MIYEINEKNQILQPLASRWNPKELELEKYLITFEDSGAPVLSNPYFGEQLLIISNQVRTVYGKRADILALDKAGNSVIIELKRGIGKMGVETQALQYLAEFSRYKGKNFLKRFSSSHVPEDTILGFCGNGAAIEDLNSRSRIILLAQDFDDTLFSMGEWLSSKGVAFRCVRYTPFEKSGTRMLSFSVAFDRSPDSLFDLSLPSKFREPAIFWHNIARANQGWWEFLRTKGQIPACFENMPGDQGEKVLTKYIEGDRIIAFAKGFGAIGWGIVENPNYRLVRLGDNLDDKLDGDCRHRINIRWKATAKNLKEGLPSDRIYKEFNIYHPVSTSVSIRTQDGERLIKELSDSFSNE